jgi:branched-subunit amino acid transport protein
MISKGLVKLPTWLTQILPVAPVGIFAACDKKQP